MQYRIIKDNTMDPTKEAINLDELQLDIGQLDATGAVTLLKVMVSCPPRPLVVVWLLGLTV
jgi:hypothetical protein